MLDLNLDQELASIDQYPLFLVFLYLQNAYNTVDRGRLLTTLEVNSSGPHVCKLLVVFWNQQEVVTHQNHYHCPHFKLTMGTNQGGLVLPTLSNLILDSVVRICLALMVEDQLVAQKRLELAVGRCLGLFYTNDGMVGSQSLEWT